MTPGHFVALGTQAVIDSTCNYLFTAPGTCSSFAIIGHEITEAIVNSSIQAGAINIALFSEITKYKLGAQILAAIAIKSYLGPMGLIADTVISMLTVTVAGSVYDFFMNADQIAEA